jgi:hypothetical protein
MICQGGQRNTPEYMLCPLRMSDCPELRNLGTMEKREVCIAIMDGFRERVNRILRSATVRPYAGCQICDGPHQLQVGMGPSGVDAECFTLQHTVLVQMPSGCLCHGCKPSHQSTVGWVC